MPLDNPDENSSITDTANGPAFENARGLDKRFIKMAFGQTVDVSTIQNPYAPLSSETPLLLMEHQHNNRQLKSDRDFVDLVATLQSPGFKRRN